MVDAFTAKMRFTLWLLVIFLLPIFTAAQSTCDDTTGRTERNDFYASDIQTRIYYTVYLPPCYDAAAGQYPVLYLMHGSNEDDGLWGRLGLYTVLDEGISRGELPPVIAVMPFGEWVANQNRFDTFSWASVFLNQLMPMAESQYRINASREHRAIGGISRGGFWAYHIGLKHPHLFNAIGGHSAFFDLYHAPPDDNPLHLASQAPDVDTLRLWIDRGRDDFAAPGLDIMDARLAERGVPYTYIIHPEGQHNNAYWSQHIRDYVGFYVEAWQPAVLEDMPAQPLIFATNTPQLRPSPMPASTVQPATDDADVSEGVYLLLPVVAFPSFQQSEINLGQLTDDPKLVLTSEVAAVLEAQGIAFGGRIRDDAHALVWQDRTLFTLMPFDRLSPRYRVLNVDGLHPLDSADYPLMFASDAPNFYPERLTRLLMSGVTALTRQTRDALDANGVDWAAMDIQDYVGRADYFHISNEVSFIANCPQPSGQMLGGNSSFCSKPEHFDLFTLLGVNIVELSGNHNNDYGYQPYFDTLAWYEAQGMATIGGGQTLEAARQPLIIEHHGNRIAMLACNDVGPYYALVNEDPDLLGGVRPGAASCDRAWLREVLPQLSAENDLVILTVQYFEEDDFAPTQQQQLDFRSFVQLGADVVLGTSSHFPQTFEFVAKPDGSPAFIHYGMGNLFFDQTFFGGVRFFMDQLYIYEGRLMTVDLFTGIIEEQVRPRPMTAEERLNFLFLIFNQYGGF